MSPADSETSIINHGVVAYFDILGYQSIVNNMQIQGTAKQVVDVLSKIRDAVYLRTLNELKKIEEPTGFKKLIDKLDWIVFSDTILITSSIPTDAPSEDQHLDWIVFLLIASDLQGQMFKYGCPTRGAIAYGDFYIKKQCFAGRPIIEAYRLTTQLDLAACVLCKSAEKALEDLRSECSDEDVLEFLNVSLFNYLVPLNDGSEKRMQTLRWGHNLLMESIRKRTTIREVVLRSFLAHNKDTPLGVTTKIDNTEFFLTHLITRFSEVYSLKDEDYSPKKE